MLQFAKPNLTFKAARPNLPVEADVALFRGLVANGKQLFGERYAGVGKIRGDDGAPVIVLSLWNPGDAAAEIATVRSRFPDSAAVPIELRNQADQNGAAVACGAGGCASVDIVDGNMVNLPGGFRTK